jgi:hypothetical protein
MKQVGQRDHLGPKLLDGLLLLPLQARRFGAGIYRERMAERSILSGGGERTVMEGGRAAMIGADLFSLSPAAAGCVILTRDP